jgi:hypothetical protein
MSRRICLAFLFVIAPHLWAQQTTPEVSARLPAPQPLFDGFDAAVTVAGAHDSYLGWYNVVTPAISYTFSQRYYADLSMSIYPYRLAVNSDPETAATHRFVSANGDMGDMLLEVHGNFLRGPYRDIATAAMTFPTGNRDQGLGTGRVTFNLDNRLERYFGKTGAFVDVGGGDSSAFQNRLVTEDDSSLGPLAQFETGIVRWLSPNLSIQSLAYEQLPIGDQKTYTTTDVRPSLVPVTVATGRRVIEDNGFNTTANMILSEHLMLTGSYNRSLRLHLDTVSVGLTFTLRSLPFRNSLIDKAIREAERGETASFQPKN